MSNYGSTFRRIRLGKGLSLENVSKGIMSKQGLSNFETGKTDIRISLLIDLLNRLQISIEEFVHDCEFQDSHQQSIEKLRLLYLRHNTDGLASCSKYFQQKFLTSNNKQFLHLSIIADILLSNLQDRTIPIADTLILVDYLKKIETWGVYEIELFGTTLSALPIRNVKQIGNLILKKIPTIDEANTFSRYQASYLFFNIISYLFDHNDIQDVPQMLQLVNSIHNCNDLHSSFLLTYYHELFDYFIGIVPSSDKCWHCILILRDLGNAELLDVYSRDLKKRELQRSYFQSSR
ncbi:helix-turn-helix domain-containing protein [Lapidilactobacillus bayanensis]|uniref:helix-turn-helix domain-containing protein n=1 Tax=Lapidilactobacillus bayanensis TaxID=2485998 RepID=UPI000F77FD17|nr:Rgg/GadR/MutR family transcriptional regulator [Lapidilactobacillus bayanensis]